MSVKQKYPDCSDGNCDFCDCYSREECIQNCDCTKCSCGYGR